MQIYDPLLGFVYPSSSELSWNYKGNVSGHFKHDANVAWTNCRVHQDFTVNKYVTCAHIKTTKKQPLYNSYSLNVVTMQHNISKWFFPVQDVSPLHEGFESLNESHKRTF